ncbi:MAG TPA: class I SAM-dependent methyltransferase, partial [Opitutaceae bacterium]|nr:class I SAM-dependent methyltransferase [Opitutaceae bacterium]
MSRIDSSLTQEHLATVRRFYDGAPTVSNWAARSYRALLSHYYNLLIPADASVLEIGCGSGELLARLNCRRKVGVDLSTTQITAARIRVPEAEFHVQAGEELELKESFDCIVISDTLNFSADVQLLLERLHTVSHAGTRLLINYHSTLWRPVLSLGRLLGIKAGDPRSNWLASSDIRNLLQLANWSPLTFQGRLLVPAACFGIDRLINRSLAPLMS